MADMKVLARLIGRNHELAEELWKTREYEARTVAALVDGKRMGARVAR